MRANKKEDVQIQSVARKKTKGRWESCRVCVEVAETASEENSLKSRKAAILFGAFASLHKKKKENIEVCKCDIWSRLKRGQGVRSQARPKNSEGSRGEKGSKRRRQEGKRRECTPINWSWRYFRSSSSIVIVTSTYPSIINVEGPFNKH